MKAVPPPVLGLVVAFSIWSVLPASADTLFQDDFGGQMGERLIQRTLPTPGGESVAFVGHTQLILNGAGQVVSTNGGGAVSLPLPEIKSGDVITLSASVRSAGDPVSWIGIGFTREAETLSSFGQITAAVRADGEGRVFTGAQKDGFTLYRDKVNVAGSENNITGTVRLSLSFNTGNFNLLVKIDDTVIYEGPVDYTTLDGLRYATFELVRQNNSTENDPGMVDGFQVEISRP